MPDDESKTHWTLVLFGPGPLSDEEADEIAAAIRALAAQSAPAATPTPDDDDETPND